MNILLTTMSTLPEFQNVRKSLSYYQYKGLYCTGISQQEAGTKTILSTLARNKKSIDKIIVVGSDETIQEGELRLIKNLYDFEVNDITTCSSFYFYLYRMQQFLKDEDIEFENKEINDNSFELYDQFCKEYELTYKDFKNKEASEKLEAFLFEKGCRNEFNNMKDCMFSEVNTSELMRNIFHKYNKNRLLPVQFVPLQITKKGNKIDNISGIVNEILKTDQDIHLYIDMQGGGRTDGFVRNSVLSILNNDLKQNVIVEAVMAIDFRTKWILNNVINEIKRYKISDLASGMDAFLRYGKVDQIKEYIKETKNQKIKELLNIMEQIDKSLSLCDIGRLETTILSMRKFFNENEIQSIDEMSDIFSILTENIKKDYGRLLEGNGNEIDTLELIKWAMNKKFYQQALTIIEARFPTLLVKDGIYYYANKYNRTKVMDSFAQLYNGAPSKDKYQFGDIDHYFVKYYEKNKRFLNGRDRIEILSICRDEDRRKSLIKKYSKVSRLRNEINHSSEGKRIGLNELKDEINQLLRQYASMKEFIKNERNPSVRITFDEVKNKAKSNSR